MPHGDLSGELILDQRRFYRRPLVLCFIALALFLLWFVPWIPRLYSDSLFVTRIDAKGKPIKIEVGRNTKQWVPIENVSKHVLHAIIVAEDGRFYDHHGFDFGAIKKAYLTNQKQGRFARGGSTISQQVVKMAFLSREKTYIRKFREAAGTLLMELIVPKQRILEWYINLTEFGGGIYGVKQAGQLYFKTGPSLLTTEQAIHLALVIPSPTKWSKGLKARHLTPFGERRFKRIATNLKLSGFIGSAELETVLARGNFGAPIAGSRIADANDDDDCRGADKECLDDDLQKVGTPIEPSDPEFVIDTVIDAVIEAPQKELLPPVIEVESMNLDPPTKEESP
ncbi:MAG: monofunctional biosynthetic peptidoglycan transglycosylase [Proteobacteria bacterium]|nr:monofunctional biosynthetic peptidoglycan transglycosylase [Pseudomonadota bacterium]